MIDISQELFIQSNMDHDLLLKLRTEGSVAAIKFSSAIIGLSNDDQGGFVNE